MDDTRTFKDSYREHLLLSLPDDDELVAQAQAEQQQSQQREALPVGQAVDAIGSAILSSIPAGWAGIIAGIQEAVQTGGDVDAALKKATEEIQRVQEAGMIMPTTEEGAQATEKAASAMEVLGQPAQFVGEKTLEATGSPLLATAADLFLDPVNLALAGGSALAYRSAKTAGKSARSGIDSDLSPESELPNDIADAQEAFMGIRSGGRKDLPDPRERIVTDAGVGDREKTGAWVTKSKGQALSYSEKGDVVPVEIIDEKSFAVVDYAPNSTWMLAREGTNMTLPNGDVIDVSGRSTNDIARYAREQGIPGVKFEGLIDSGGFQPKSSEQAKMVSDYRRGNPVTQYVIINEANIKPKKETK